jgi:hypothetical protein
MRNNGWNESRKSSRFCSIIPNVFFHAVIFGGIYSGFRLGSKVLIFSYFYTQIRRSPFAR